MSEKEQEAYNYLKQIKYLKVLDTKRNSLGTLIIITREGESNQKYTITANKDKVEDRIEKKSPKPMNK